MSDPNKANGSCNAVFPKLTSVPARNKDLVLTSPDGHGEPALTSFHGVCAARFGTDAYDWGFCWKVWDSLRSCAYTKLNCRYALGDTVEHRYIGTWSDGVPIIGLKVQDVAPIRAQPVPNRQSAPKTRPATDRPPRAGLTEVVRSAGKPVGVRGTASDDHGVAGVEVAVVRTSGGGCRQMTPAGTFVALARCARPTSFLRARGTKRWSVRLPAPLRRGAYRAFVLVTDSSGQQPPRAVSKSFQVAL